MCVPLQVPPVKKESGGTVVAAGERGSVAHRVLPVRKKPGKAVNLVVQKTEKHAVVQLIFCVNDLQSIHTIVDCTTKLSGHVTLGRLFEQEYRSTQNQR